MSSWCSGGGGAPPPILRGGAPRPSHNRAGDTGAVRCDGGKATHDALRDLALQFESWQFVGVREREARLRREQADATAEALRTFQLCASTKLPKTENLSRVLRPVAHNLCRRLLARVGRVMDARVVADVDRAILAIQADSTSKRRPSDDDDDDDDDMDDGGNHSGGHGGGGDGGGGGAALDRGVDYYSPEEDATDGEYTVIRMLGGGGGGGKSEGHLRLRARQFA